MIMVSEFSNFPDELSEKDPIKRVRLSGSDCTQRFFDELTRVTTLRPV